MNSKVLELIEMRKKSVSSPVKVWRFPEPGKSYILAADPCMGTEGSDNAAIEVIDAETGEQCAEFAQVVSPEDLAPIVLNLARLYNNAEVAIETNYVGLITNRIVMAQYENIYRFKRLDRFTNLLSDMPGWWTDVKSRARMVSVFHETVLSNLELIHSAELIDELLSHVEDGPALDDQVNAMMIAQAVRAERMVAV
jgi:hypothetical protein